VATKKAAEWTDYFRYLGLSAHTIYQNRVGKPGLFMNPNSLSVVGSTETVRQWLGVLQAAMGGANGVPNSTDSHGDVD